LLQKCELDCDSFEAGSIEENIVYKMTQLEYIHLTAWMLLTGMSRTGQAYHNIYHKLAKSLVGRGNNPHICFVSVRN